MVMGNGNGNDDNNTNDDYYEDYDDDSYEGSVSEGSHWDNGFNAGYEAAKQDLVKLAQKRDAQGRFVK